MNWVDKMWLEKTPAAWYICDPSDFGVIRYQHTIFSPYRPMKPNVHEYPESATERELLQYKIAVEQAALDGKPIEFSKAYRNQWSEYGVHNVPAFCWGEWHYRVARPKIAEGHNPAGVTEDQIPAGWRIFSKEERDVLRLKTLEDTRYWMGSRWSDSTFCCLLDSCYGTLITQKPAGFYLPKPKIAEGHNPDNLTEDQVGVRDGYRLLTADEIKGPKQAGVEYWEAVTPRWAEANSPAVHFDGVSYRTKAAPGEYLPKPRPVQPSPSVQPTTVLGWLNMLPAGYRERALKNRRPDDDDLGCSCLGLALLYLPWLGSPEGTQFWSDVYDAVTRGDAFPPLPAPKKLVPWTFETFVWPNCVRTRNECGLVSRALLVTEARANGMFVGAPGRFLSWQELADGYDYTIDAGQTWRPCCRTEDAS